MENQPKHKIEICSICGDNYIGLGNNAWPVNPGRCCDPCNALVVNHRIMNVRRGLSAYADPEWYAKVISTVTDFWRESKSHDHEEESV